MCDQGNNVFCAAIMMHWRSPRSAWATTIRDNEYASSMSAQYCISQFDELPATTRVYC